MGLVTSGIKVESPRCPDAGFDLRRLTQKQICKERRQAFRSVEDDLEGCLHIIPE